MRAAQILAITFLIVPANFGVAAAQLTVNAFDAASGEFPDQQCDGWDATTNAATEALIVEDKLILATNNDTDNLSYLQGFPGVGTPAELVIEFRMRFVSGSAATNNRSPAAIGFTTGVANRKNVLNIEDGGLFLLIGENSRGPEAAVTTGDAVHAYRMVVDPNTGEIDVFYDDALVLEGNTFTDPEVTAPRVFFGEASSLAHGESEWEFFSHNASTKPKSSDAPACGDPVADGAGLSRERARIISASDSLLALRASVGSACCQLCGCDVNDSLDITATDALLILRAAVGSGVTLTCPACE